MNRMRRRALIVAVGTTLGVAEARAQVIWTNGAGDGDWHNDGNWSSGLQPRPEDSVVIPQGFEGIASLGVFVRELSAQSPLFVAGGGTYSVLGATLAQFETTGGFLTDGEAVFRGPTSVQTSGTWRATLGFRNVGEFNATSMPLFQTTFTNEGTLRIENGPVFVGAAAVLENNATLELRSGGHLFSAGRLNNNATWRKVGSGESVVACVVRHTGGSLNVQDGLLRLLGGGSYGAPVVVGLGGTLRLEGPFVEPAHSFSGASVSGGGELEIQCGNNGVEILSETTISMQGDDGLHMQSGEVRIAPFVSLRNEGTMRWDGGAFEGSGTLVNNGSLLVPVGRSVTGRTFIKNLGDADIQGFLTLSDGSVFQNVFNTELSGEVRAPIPVDGVLQNLGTIRVVPPIGGASRITSYFQQSFGTTTLERDSLSLVGGGLLDGGSMISSGTLGFDSGTFLVAGNPEICATTDGEVRFRGAGTVVNVTGQLALGGDGPIFLESNASMGGTGGILNAGNFVWNSTIGVAGQAQFLNGGLVTIPTGSARLRGLFANAAIVLQQGSLDMASSTVGNLSKWILEPASAATISISGAGGLYNNFNVLSAEAPVGAGHGANITTTLDNQGTVQAIGGITLTIAGQLVQLQNGVLTGGTWLTAEGGRIILPGVPPIRKLMNVKIEGSQQGMPWLSGVDDVEGSELVANDDIAFTRPLNASGDNVGQRGSVVRLSPGADVTVPEQTTIGRPDDTVVSYVEEATVFASPLEPPRLITPVLVVHGGVRPGGPDAPGPFDLIGDLSMRAGGIVEVDVGGRTPEAEHDVLTITGAADLDGVVRVRTLPAYAPAVGDRMTILIASLGIEGRFASEDLPEDYALEYRSDRVELVYLGCPADLDGNGVLNIFDFLAFQTAFGGQAPVGDFDGNGLFNVFDFLAFQTAFANGC